MNIKTDKYGVTNREFKVLSISILGHEPRTIAEYKRVDKEYKDLKTKQWVRKIKGPKKNRTSKYYKPWYIRPDGREFKLRDVKWYWKGSRLVSRPRPLSGNSRYSRVWPKVSAYFGP